LIRGPAPAPPYWVEDYGDRLTADNAVFVHFLHSLWYHVPGEDQPRNIRLAELNVGQTATRHFHASGVKRILLVRRVR
jgi:hypothetical protein